MDETPAIDQALRETLPHYERQKNTLGDGVAAAFDPTLILGFLREIFTMISQLCGGGLFQPPPRPGEVAAAMKAAANGDETHRNLLSHLWRSCEKVAARNITRDNNPTGGRIKGRELRDMRYDAARRSYWAMVDSAKTADLSVLTEAVAEARQI